MPKHTDTGVLLSWWNMLVDMVDEQDDRDYPVTRSPDSGKSESGPVGREAVWYLATRNGYHLKCRRMQPWDRVRLIETFQDLSPETRYYRYLTMVNRLSGARLESIVDVNNPLQTVIGVSEESGSDADGVAIFRTWRESLEATSAEFAITITDDWQGKGLGKTLMYLMMLLSRQNGIDLLTGQVHMDNKAMKGLLRNLGASLSAGDAGAMNIHLPVPLEKDIRTALDQRLEYLREDTASLADLVD